MILLCTTEDNQFKTLYGFLCYSKYSISSSSFLKLYHTGETGDTLNALRYCHSARARIVGVTNTVGSSLSKESDCGIHINAGPEIGVASTKAYTSQFISLVMFALVMSNDSYKKVERRKQVKLI